MKLDIAWHNIPPSKSITDEVNNRFEKLRKLCDDIISARISLDQPHHPNKRPHAYSVMLELHVPNTTIVVDHARSEEQSENLHQLLHHTFDAARRQVRDYRRVRQGKVKRHSTPQPPPHEEANELDDNINEKL